MEHLIANTGIQFITTEAQFNPSEPLRMESGRVLRYSFVESVDPFNPEIVNFDLLYNHTEENVWIPVKQLRDEHMIAMLANGLEEVDESGVPKMAEGRSAALFESYPDDDESIININTFESYRVANPADIRDKTPALNLLLDKWLPMPMFEVDETGNTTGMPMGWCRVLIRKVGEGSEKGTFRYHLTWAIDTHLADNPLSVYFPYFYDDSVAPKKFAICSKPDALFNFLSTEEDQDANARYIASLLHIEPEKIERHRFKYLAYYIYLINFIRKIGAAPEITLHNPHEGDIPVDMVLDIGNSRTCGVLCEDSDFTRSVMLELRDLTSPWIAYNDPFDMRLVFRKPDFGNDLILPEEAFAWKSIVRVGREAEALVYKSIENPGLSERANSYSSPKRYLWDHKNSKVRWEFMVTESDPFNVSQSRNIFLENFTDMFDDKGNFRPNAETLTVFDFDSEADISDCHYSRSSLMTFVMIEILQQAEAQINSVKYRQKHGKIDCRRRLRNVIITCPTAMPRAEQIALRQSMVDAEAVMRRCAPGFSDISVIPSPKSLRASDDFDSEVAARRWSFDEASACQLVYLYAEIAQRYNGRIERFFDTKGHRRPDLEAEGYDRNSLTVASIDIGAGTTDIMVCAYKYEAGQNSHISPAPLFYDSFYLAGDDILQSIVRRIVIQGDDTGQPDQGSIHSALVARLLVMTDDQLRSLPAYSAEYSGAVYRKIIEDIISSPDAPRREQSLRYLASLLIRDFFGHDSAMMSFNDRQARLDFNTQVSVPLARRMMDLLRLHRPAKTYTFAEMFPTLKPSAHLLEHFRKHFGFDFCELSWRYNPDEIAAIARAVMEPLMKQLSMVLYAYHCDVLVLAGRPTSIDAIPELFLKYIPLSPDRIIRLNDYRVGTWYPFADGQGYFYDQKSVVAVGAIIGHLASTTGFNGLRIDFSEMVRRMKSTANYIGFYDTSALLVSEPLLTPLKSTASATIAVFPSFLGCKQFSSSQYHGRPLYGIFRADNGSEPLRLTLSRSYQEDREKVEIEEVTDTAGNSVPKSSVEIIQQSIAADGKHWLDKGEFDLSLK